MNTVPLSPIDLTKIYKQKVNDPDFVLKVDYEGSKEKLKTKQILIYLANTAFKCEFESVDSQLIKDYIELDFIVNSPRLARVVANIIKLKQMKEELSISAMDDIDTILDFDIAEMDLFIEENEELIDTLMDTISAAPLFIMNSINEMEDTKVTFDHGMEIKKVSKDQKIGVNLVQIMSSGFDAVLDIFENKGINPEINVDIFNDDSKYNGNDIMKEMHDTGLVASIITLLPKELMNSEIEE